MSKPKTPKPDTVSKKDVAKSQRRLTRLEKQLTRSNRRNMRLVDKLVASQQATQQQATQQVSLLEQAAIAQAAPPAEPPEQQTAAVQSWSDTVANAQSDAVTSRAVAEYRANQQLDAYRRTQLVQRALRSKQFT